MNIKEIIKELNWKCFMIKVRYWLFESFIKRTYNIFKHCRKGYHKFKPDYLHVTKTKNKKTRTIINVKYMQCLNCECLSFFNQKDKEKYIKYQNRKDKFIGKWADLTLKERNGKNKKWKKEK